MQSLGFYPIHIKLTQYGFVDTGRRHKNPESETKDFTTHVGLHQLSSPERAMQRAHQGCCTCMIVLQDRNTELEGFTTCITNGSKLPLWGEMLPLSSRWLATSPTRTNAQVGAIRGFAGILSRNLQGHSGPMADCFHKHDLKAHKTTDT